MTKRRLVLGTVVCLTFSTINFVRTIEKGLQERQSAFRTTAKASPPFHDQDRSLSNEETHSEGNRTYSTHPHNANACWRQCPQRINKIYFDHGSAGLGDKHTTSTWWLKWRDIYAQSSKCLLLLYPWILFIMTVNKSVERCSGRTFAIWHSFRTIHLWLVWTHRLEMTLRIGVKSQCTTTTSTRTRMIGFVSLVRGERIWWKIIKSSRLSRGFRRK